MIQHDCSNVMITLIQSMIILIIMFHCYKNNFTDPNSLHYKEFGHIHVYPDQSLYPVRLVCVGNDVCLFKDAIEKCYNACMHVCMNICMYACMYVCMHVCMCVM